MSPRPRTISDEEVFQGTVRAIGRVGPAKLTLADVGREVGLAPATLIQRFGTKRGLLLALVRASNASLGEEFAAARAGHASPLGALAAVLEGMTRGLDTPEVVAHHVALLQMDLSDPEFRAEAREHSRTLEAELRRLLEEAVRAGELRPCDTARLARAALAAFNGAMMQWALHAEGTIGAWVEDTLATLFAPLRPEEPPAAPRARPSRR
ncbi:TetR family transcriptional regulator [Myxococcaceae bacterium GXIMD 01537]